MKLVMTYVIASIDLYICNAFYEKRISIKRGEASIFDNN